MLMNRSYQLFFLMCFRALASISSDAHHKLATIKWALGDDDAALSLPLLSLILWQRLAPRTSGKRAAVTKKRKLMKYEKLPESAAETPQQAVNTVGEIIIC